MKKANFRVGQVVRLGYLCFPPTQHKFWKIKHRRYFLQDPGVHIGFSATFPQWAYILETGGGRDHGSGWYHESSLLELTPREKDGRQGSPIEVSKDAKRITVGAS